MIEMRMPPQDDEIIKVPWKNGKFLVFEKKTITHSRMLFYKKCLCDDCQRIGKAMESYLDETYKKKHD